MGSGGERIMLPVLAIETSIGATAAAAAMGVAWRIPCSTAAMVAVVADVVVIVVSEVGGG